ncbi:MAG: ATP-binding cassette domain-containing protein [Prolixibacteraceae bacterium]|jgi:multidrug efflux pump subunit AcrB/ABC-type multidrug transport system ATPase subunit|nr:ATP-binding cassette domain-containing protein [Prolixibacteraceae bacterium]MBT7000111.1 ATP-binding cassette domain-containing protein [Prolixibacteraceae bacterium]MBT7395019.1 ATP-binding cassette domain-containing protein [Prolixibacteraceae bacterium]
MKFIINRKILISMVFLGLTLLGYISYKRLPVELMPNAELPMLFVQINSRIEVDPNYMENQAVIPIEGAISTLEGIESLESFLNNRNASIQVNFKQNVNFKYTFLKLQEKIDQVTDNLDENFTVTVNKVDIQQLTNQFMELQIRGSGGTDRLRNIVDQEITAEMENIDGVASVTVFGGKERSIEVTYDGAACEAYDITPSQIRNAINQNSRNRTFTGYLHDSQKQYFVHVTAEYDQVSDIENIIVAEGPVYLKDVADVYFGVKEEETISRINGLDAISMLLVSDSQANLIDLSHKVEDRILELNKKLAPKEIEIVVQTNLAETMEKNIDQIINLALVGGLLAIFVLWMFLKNLKIVSFIALAIPISVFTAFNLFYAFNISLNSLTLVGLVLAIGMLLDNSVVVLENIYRLSGKGFSADRAVTQGTQEVWRSIVAATLTTVTVFLPFVFSSDYMVKLLGNHVGVSIISTLMVSLFVALLLIPMAAHVLLKGKSSHNIFYEKVTTNNRIIQIYILLLKASMRVPARTVIGAIVLFFITIFIVLAISVNSLEEVEETQFSVYITMPTGSTLESTDLVAAEVEKRLSEIAEKQDIISKVQEEEAILTVILQEDYKDIDDRTVAEIKSEVEDLVERVSQAEISLTAPTSSASFRGGGGGGGGGSGTENFSNFMGIGTNQERIVIKGEDFELMKGVADDLQYYIEDLESIRSASVSVASNRPEVHLYFNQLLLTEYGLTLSNISNELSSFSREFTSGVNFNQGNEEYEIIIKEDLTEEEEEKDTEKGIEDLRRLQISGSQGATYDLQDISDLVYADGMSSITRVNQEKQIELTYRFVDEAQQSKDLLEAYRMEIEEIVGVYKVPSGVAIELIQEEDQFSEFYFLIAAAFILIIMILASVFESVSTPFVLMFSVPLAAIGSFLALIFTGNSLFNANTLTGFLILLGVVVNNGIILIDFTNILRKRGYRKSRALMTAGLSRVRPILITAITTIVAMFPLAMGQAEYVGAIGAPFAITVIGGLALSTILTLIFIPTLYAGLESALDWMKSLHWMLKTGQMIVFIVGAFYIYYEVDTFIWQMLDFMILVILVPGVTAFVMTSLRQASSKVIDENEAIRIDVRKLVKIYDRDNRFVREWKSGLKIRERAGLLKDFKHARDFYDLIWQLPLFGFLVYFTFFYIESNFWMWTLSHFVFFFIFLLRVPLNQVLINKNEATSKPIYLKINNIVKNLIYWLVPLIFLFVFYKNWDNLGMVIFVGIIWYVLLIIYSSAEYIHNKNVNIARIAGRFATLRRGYFTMVRQIPVIGKRNKPFRALNGVSLKIRTGMFGLLGPNGAGKSTMMRIICGILEQSYGKIWINGLDTQKHREELQGLIGYLPQAFGTYENMSAWEFLEYQAILKGIKDSKVRSERLEYVLKNVHMFDRRDDKIGSFSGGMKQRIGIAQILINLPRILVVDEPTAGLDPRERIRFRNLLVELSRERIVIFSTHIIEDISSSCNQVAVINKGDLKYFGTPEEMATMGEKFVWQFSIPANKFDDFANKQLIVHHMRDGENIKLRCLAKEKPAEDAVNVAPHLEDAYLCLLKDFV